VAPSSKVKRGFLYLPEGLRSDDLLSSSTGFEDIFASYFGATSFC